MGMEMPIAAKELAFKSRAARVGETNLSNDSSYTRFNMNHGAATLVEFDDQQIVVPEGAIELCIQPRLRGDIYAEIRGRKFCVSGVAENAADAVRAAVSKVPA